LRTGVVALAFGTPYSIYSNRLISSLASDIARESACGVFTQKEVEFDPDISVFRIDGDEVPTLRIAREAINWASEHGMDTLYVVAAEPHLWRVFRDLGAARREMGVDVTIEVCDEVYQEPKESWFCDDSTQRWTKTQKAWNRRERILKLMPFFIYKRIAS